MVRVADGPFVEPKCQGHGSSGTPAEPAAAAPVAVGYKHICYQVMWEIELGSRHNLHGFIRVSLLAVVRVPVTRGTSRLQQCASRQVDRQMLGTWAAAGRRAG